MHIYYENVLNTIMGGYSGPFTVPYKSRPFPVMTLIHSVILVHYLLSAIWAIICLGIASSLNQYMYRYWFTARWKLAPYTRQWTGSAFVQVIACRLFGAKPLPEPMLANCQMDSWEQISVKLESEFYHFQSRKCILKCRLPEWRPFCPGDIREGRCFSQQLFRLL